MHRYEVIIEFYNHNKCRLIKWADKPKHALWMAMRDWDMPQEYTEITVVNARNELELWVRGENV